MAINTIKATMQMRRGAEQHFDPDQMTAGEWAVSTDSKKVWMCFAPGIVRRMATYEAFEEDMRIIQQILATCEEIQTAVESFEKLAEQHKNQAESYSKASQSWAVGGTGTRDGEDTDNSKYYSQQSQESATSAASSAATATEKAASAGTSATNAANSASSASSSAATATQKATEAGNSAQAAGESAQTAADSAADANESKEVAVESAGEADARAKAAKSHERMAQSYAVGTGGEVRENDDNDSAKGYYEQSKRLAQGFNGIIPMGTITFSQLSDPENQVPKYMFNISDAFTSDERFTDGGGIYYGAGNNVIFTADGMWDALAASAVTGVKGEAETDYRQGNVNITKEDVGVVPASAGAAGIVKPDGTTTKTDPDGTMHAIIPEATIDYNELDNKPSINGKTLSENKTLEELGGASVVRLTQSQYDALPDTKLTDNKIYLITDGGANSGWPAEKIYYYNGTSGLMADNVQDAIDEIAGKLSPEGIGAIPENAKVKLTGDVTGEAVYNTETGVTQVKTTVNNVTYQPPSGVTLPSNTVTNALDELFDANSTFKKERFARVGITTSSALTWKEFARIVTSAADSYGKITFLVTRCHKSNQSIFGILCFSYTWIGGKYTFSLDWIYATDNCYTEGFACDLYTTGTGGVQVMARVSCAKDYVWTFTVLEEDVDGVLNNYEEHGWMLFDSITTDGDVGSGSNSWTSEFKYSVLRGAQFKNITTEFLNLRNSKCESVGKNSWISYAADGNGEWRGASSITGLLRVVLPQSWSNTMVRFTVSIFEYTLGACADYHISGYSYQDKTWNNCTAVCVGKKGNKFADLPVKFGKTENNETAITIGNIDTVWHYPKVYIHNIMVGQENVDFDKWAQGWDIKIWPYEMNTIQVTISHPHVTYEEPIIYYKVKSANNNIDHDNLPWPTNNSIKDRFDFLNCIMEIRNDVCYVSLFFQLNSFVDQRLFLTPQFKPVLNMARYYPGVCFTFVNEQESINNSNLCYVLVDYDGKMYLWAPANMRGMISFAFPIRYD